MWTLHKMCCRKLLKYTELIRKTNSQAFVKECGQTTEIILLDKREHQSVCCGELMFCLTFSPSLDFSVCCLPFSSFTAFFSSPFHSF